MNWWTRSAYGDDNYWFYYVVGSDWGNDGDADTLYGVAPAFRIGN